MNNIAKEVLGEIKQNISSDKVDFIDWEEVVQTLRKFSGADLATVRINIKNFMPTFKTHTDKIITTLRLIKLINRVVCQEYKYDIVQYLIENGDYYVSNIFGHKCDLKDDRERAYEYLDYIPVDNLKKMLAHIEELVPRIADRFSYISLIENAAELGYLAFEPYITVNDYLCPVLVLKYNRYVHLYCEYYYQVSYTANGIGEYRRANNRIDHLRDSLAEELHESTLLKYLYYMNLIQACTGIDNFDKVLRYNSSLIDKFMQLSTIKVFNSFDITYSQMKNAIFNNKQVNRYTNAKFIYRIAASDTRDILRLNVYSNTSVGITKMLEGRPIEIVAELPVLDMINQDLRMLIKLYNMIDRKAIEIYENAVKDTPAIFESFVTFILNTAKIVVNHLVAYSCEQPRPETMPALNDKHIIKIETVDNIKFNIGEDKIYEYKLIIKQ